VGEAQTQSAGDQGMQTQTEIDRGNSGGKTQQDGGRQQPEGEA
jgi:hypothetical protein